MQRKDIVIVTPALPEANNGNRHTAHQRAGRLRGCHGVRLASTSGGGDEAAELRQGPGPDIKVRAGFECPGSAT